jgi:D-xylonolactonase
MSNVTTPTFEVLANEHCAVGEGPLWDERRKRLYWTDIETGRLFCWDASTGKHRQIYSGESVGGFTLQDDGSLVLFRDNNIAHMTDDGKVKVLKDKIDPAMVRFNDVTADPEGRVYAGTIGQNGSGGVYRIDCDLKVTRLFQGTDCSNGMGFTPDQKHMYWTCTSSGRIYRFRYNSSSGALDEQTVLVEVPLKQGYVDGMHVDAAGNIWSARWDGSAVHCFSPAGKELAVLQFPVKKCSSVTFGGDGFTDMFITTAGGNGADNDDDNPLNGALLRVKSNAKGRPAFRSRIAAS